MNSENANVSQQQKDEVKKLRDELQEAIDKNDMEGLKAKLDALEKAAQEMGQAMYQQQQQANPGTDAGSSNTTSSNDDVVDADFSEKK